MSSTPFQAVPTTNPYLGAIQWGGWQWQDGPASGTNITYYFAGAGENLNNAFGSGFGISALWLQSEKMAFSKALQQWSNVANLSFSEVFTYQQADLVEFIFANSSSDILGAHETPESAFQLDGTAWGGFNSAGDGWSDSLFLGGYGFITLVHEIGHALGLAHPHDNGGGSLIFPGVTPDQPSDLGDFGLNQGVYTTMSYNSGWSTGPLGLTPSYLYGWEAGPMAFDIAAIQSLYGANSTFENGDNIYVLPDTNGSGTFYSCIWDAGGVDQISYNGSRSAFISLTAATLDASPTGGGIVSYASGVHGGVTIANGVIIENAAGGSGNDFIFGSSLANSLYGNAGIDYLDGGDGNDALFGGVGGDNLQGGGGADYLLGGEGHDFLFGLEGDDVLYGDATEFEAGIDVMLGGEGNDAILGLAGSDVLYGGNGNDLLLGGVATDWLFGDAGNDVLYAGDGLDFLYGGTGSDWYIPESGVDYLYFDAASGVDTVLGWTDGEDFIVFNGSTAMGLRSIADLSIADGGSYVAISFAGNTTFILGASASQFGAADFFFA